MASSSQGPATTATTTATATLLAALPITHPSFVSLLDAFAPLAHPSALSSSHLHKLLSRINAALLPKENGAEKKAAHVVASAIVLQDLEGYVLNNWGKAWVTASLGAVASTSLVLSTVTEPLALLSSIILSSPHYPSFEREAIHPILGKVAVAFSRLLERALSEGAADLDTLSTILETTRTILEHSPAPFRPVVPTLKPILHTILLSLPIPSASSSLSIPFSAPLELRQKAADLLASLHLASGKAQIPSSWASAMRDALAGLNAAMDGITQDGWEEEAVQVAAPSLPAGLPPLPSDPALRLVAGLDWLEGFTEQVLALSRYSTSRPVPIPIAQIVSAGLRTLNLTLDTPTLAYVSPQHHAALVASLPRIWTSGLLLIGAVATATGDHLLPHLSSILDHTTWLAERVPASMTTVHIQLLRFHHLLFTLYPSSLAPIDYPTRLLKVCLSQYAPLLDSKSPSSTVPTTNGGGGKRGKKRARGAEDGLIGGLEGREGRAASEETVHVALAALNLAVLLHPTPLLAPSLLTFSIRLHLSLHLHLSSAPSTAFARPQAAYQLREAVSDVLGNALYMTEGEQGTSKGWKVAILAVLPSHGEQTSLLLHPSLPPLNRPQPPLGSLHFFTKETEEEKKVRRELGYGEAGETMEVDGSEMEVDQVSPPPPVAPAPAPVAPVVFAVPVPTIAPAASAPPVVPDPAPDLEIAVEPKTDESRVGQTVERREATSTAATPFMSAVQTTKTTLQQTTRASPTVPVIDALGDDDEPLPELDSGSSDEEDDDDEEE